MVKKADRKLINMFFGTNNDTRFKRLIILLFSIAAIIILTLNISYDKKNGFQWRPAADVDINVGDGAPKIPGGGPVAP